LRLLEARPSVSRDPENARREKGLDFVVVLVLGSAGKISGLSMSNRRAGLREDPNEDPAYDWIPNTVYSLKAVQEPCRFC
jgi:hypothetical protein